MPPAGRVPPAAASSDTEPVSVLASPFLPPLALRGWGWGSRLPLPCSGEMLQLPVPGQPWLCSPDASVGPCSSLLAGSSWRPGAGLPRPHCPHRSLTAPVGPVQPRAVGPGLERKHPEGWEAQDSGRGQPGEQASAPGPRLTALGPRVAMGGCRPASGRRGAQGRRAFSWRLRSVHIPPGAGAAAWLLGQKGSIDSVPPSSLPTGDSGCRSKARFGQPTGRKEWTLVARDLGWSRPSGP